MDKKEILDILDNAKDERGAVPMRLVRQAFDKLVQPEERTKTHAETHACDLISRQAAIDGKISIQCANGVEIYSDEAVPVEYLKALPPAQPEQQWIPVSERLPEAKQRVLVTFPDGTVDIKMCIDAGHLKWFFAHMIAWMPLPELYKGETE